MKHKTLSFRDQVFLACFLVTLVPLLLTSVVMVRLFTASLNRQSEQEANRQITEIRSRFAALLDDCEEACRELTRNGTVSRYMIDTTTIEMQRGMYVSLYQASQETTDMPRSVCTMWAESCGLPRIHCRGQILCLCTGVF